jgi:hypothetical protein
MIRGEFLCDHQYLGAARGADFVRHAPKTCKAVIAVAFYGTAKAVPFVQRVFPGWHGLARLEWKASLRG